jgi:hypothetical protein
MMLHILCVGIFPRVAVFFTPRLVPVKVNKRMSAIALLDLILKSDCTFTFVLFTPKVASGATAIVRVIKKTSDWA